MAMELDLVKLTSEQQTACHNTISPNTFFMLVGDALASEKPLSVIRMGDGEKQLYLHCQKSTGTVKWPNSPFGDHWLQDFGCYDIPCDELARRIKSAAEQCTYFAPQIMGIQREQWSVAHLFAPREHYVDNWFVRQWSRKLQDQLLKQAGRVLFIHKNHEVREAFRVRLHALGCYMDGIELRSWEQAYTTIEWAIINEAPLVLFAGGPANKYIAWRIATQGRHPKVVLDLGQAAVEWI